MKTSDVCGCGGPRSSDPLDDVLFKWPTKDPSTLRHMLRSVEVKGITGSGKSSGSGKFFTEAIVSLIEMLERRELETRRAAIKRILGEIQRYLSTPMRDAESFWENEERRSLGELVEMLRAE